ncbi:bifunctional hydroxymethylpyrimidine kinase/phosphomethylpyrimidine kinase [Haloglomus irregulare]|jgi:hydroxymethylpyrimidine/phosphomethylpyrimidine kinase|uniref:Bifunctional hydroxymethylpyrimidine kinase/phosphomethylpyrimidine kinase n=1 Tax=Haloglomus irregulare TaxID=2234134 RepID=A0A554NCF8_9EURY|nr:bifunctional hydroxymethylpyrimidine kinase/phosphomethylpyrimidine kinase [Haloglomus irregulare]TSD14700.1 bifunctional hydroxymethylpyrimidine kinase/phosphomethylpyrimidine kinase [Haloglomus irregulare]
MSTRRPAPVERPVVLTIAGSDSGGGAGIQADLKTIEACGGFGTAAVTAVTAQNTTGVHGTHVLPVEEVEAQLDAVITDFDVAAVKTGMLATAEMVETVTRYVAGLDCPVVVDPVMVAASGDRLLDEDAEDAYEALIGEATLVTPNADEAEVLTDVDVEDEAGARLAGQRLLTWGAEGALVKGGHIPGDEVLDTLVTADYIEAARHPRVDTEATHGSGCALSSAIATHLASDEPLKEAVGFGIDLLERAVRHHHDVGEGPGAVHHLVEARNAAAREPTAERVQDVVDWFVERDVSAVVPEVGMNVVGATPYAEAPEECAAVEGRVTRTLSGIQPNRGVRFGASSHVARFLLAAREYDPALRWAVNCRFADDVETALEGLDGHIAEYDRDAQPEDVAEVEASTMGWGARQAFGGDGERPVVVLDRGAHGKEPMAKFVGEDARQVAERVVSVVETLETSEE